jgi:hypothetical protein
MAQGIVLGAVVGIVLLVALPIVGAVIDTKLHPGVELAGLGGLMAGAMIGGAMLLISTVAAFVIGARRRSPILRGAGRGLLLAIGLAGLTAGICAVAM